MVGLRRDKAGNCPGSNICRKHYFTLYIKQIYFLKCIFYKFYFLYIMNYKKIKIYIIFIFLYNKLVNMSHLSGCEKRLLQQFRNSHIHRGNTYNVCRT